MIILIVPYQFFSISDHSDAQHYISQQRDVIDQVLKIIDRPRLNTKVALVAVSLLLNLAECREAHVNLFQPDLVRRIIQSVKTRKDSHSSDDQKLEVSVLT